MLAVGVYFWPGLGNGPEGLYVYLLYTHPISINLRVHTVYVYTVHTGTCVFFYTIPSLQSVAKSWLFSCCRVLSQSAFTMVWPIAYSYSVCYILHMMHMVVALRTALEISWAVASWFFPLPSSVGITACLGLFVSLAYHRGGSLAVMLRAWLSPLCCIRQQWDWAVCFISTHIKASTHWKCLRELFP